MVSILEVTRRIDYTVLAVFCVVLAGFLLGMFPVNTGYHYWDETVYLQHAEIIAGESPNNFNEFRIRPPLFSVLLGGVFLFSHSLTVAHITVAAFSALGILLTYVLGRDIFNSETGIGAAVIYAFSPIRVRLAGDIMVDSVLPVLWLLTVLIYYRSLKSSTSNRKLALSFFTGISAGLSVLMKFTSLMIVPVLGALLILYLWKKEDIELRRLPEVVFKSTENYVAAAGFILTLLPYLLWSKIAYGGFFHTFIYAWMDRGLTDFFYTYLTSLDLLVMPVFLAGFVLYFLDKSSYSRYERLLPLVPMALFFTVMQFLIRNKEVRFLLPIIPFLALAASEGFRKYLPSMKFYLIIFVSLLLFLPTGIDDMGDNPYKEGFTVSHSYPPAAEAAIWIRKNTPENTTIYTNFQEPILGYYSKKEIQWVAEYRSLENLTETYITDPGYVYYSNSTRFPHPTYSEMASHPSFTLVKSFNNLSHLFYYNGSQ